MRLVYLPSDMDAPGCYRCLFPARQLHNQGGHVVSLPPHKTHQLDDGRTRTVFTIEDFSEEYDIWILQQNKERWWTTDGVRTLRHKGIAVVSDIDDNYMELPTYNPAFLGTHPYRHRDGQIRNREVRRTLKYKSWQKATNDHNRENMNLTFAQSDLLTCSTPYLAEIYSRWNKNVKVLRNYLDWSIWETVIPQYTVERKRTRIGYLGTFKYRQGDLSVLRNVIPTILRRYDVDFVANSTEVHDYLQVPADRRFVVPEYRFWTEDRMYPVGEKTAVLDIGLVPMVMNGLNQGKSHLKGMEYNAAGVPFVATPTESYKDYWCYPGENGFLASTEKQWIEHISYLIEHDQERRNMGRMAREMAEENTYQRNWYEWEEAYEELLGDSVTKIARKAITKLAVQKVSELSSLLRFMEDKPMKTVVEVGSAGGGTFWALCQVADTDATLISIDMPAGSPLDEKQGQDVYTREGRNVFFEHAQDGQKVVTLDGNSQTLQMRGKLEEILDGRRIDLLFIDADHRYEGVKRDFELYSPLVAPGGVIAFHDIVKHKQKLAQVDKFWKEVKPGYESFEFIGSETWGWNQWGGIGVLVKEGARQATELAVR